MYHLWIEHTFRSFPISPALVATIPHRLLERIGHWYLPPNAAHTQYTPIQYAHSAPPNGKCPPPVAPVSSTKSDTAFCSNYPPILRDHAAQNLPWLAWLVRGISVVDEWHHSSRADNRGRPAFWFCFRRDIVKSTRATVPVASLDSTIRVVW